MQVNKIMIRRCKNLNIQKLKGVLVEKKKTYGDCSKVLNLSVTGFSNKMNNKSKFDIVEINTLIGYLGLDNELAIEIFFEN